MENQLIINFIKSLYPDKKVIALHEPSFTGHEKKYIEECIDSTFVSSVGPFVGRFEEAVLNFVGTGPRGDDKEGRLSEGDGHSVADRSSLSAVACVNGTAALHLALKVAGVQPGDRVITQPLSFIATANAISYAGATPVFIDVDPDTLGMSPTALRAFLQSESASFATTLTHQGSKKPRQTSRIAACVPMHTFGNPCRIDEIVGICDEYGIPVIEDAAESIGSYYKGRHTGTYGLMGVLSFNGNKTITTGGGGMVITGNKQLAAQLKHLSTQAKVPHPWEFAHDAIGYNYRLPNINAALGLAQIETLEKKLQSKRLVAQKYSGFFSGLGIPTIEEIPEARSNFWLNGFFAENKTMRDEFLQLATSQGIHCRPVWQLLPTLPMYQKSACAQIPQARDIAERLVNVPSSPVGEEVVG